jgi:predicted RNA-binding protein YlqC (UPF0109 family)
MITDFIRSYVELIVDHTDNITILQKEIDSNFIELTIVVKQEDTGKLIGKNGNMINSLKTLVNGCKAKNGFSYKIVVKGEEEA